MEYRHLQAFVVLAEELHFGRAAQVLHIAQPALSQYIKSLENSLGMLLFQRDRRNVALTWEGGQLVEQARLAVSHYQRFQEHAVTLRKGFRGLIRLGYVGSSILEPGLMAVINRYRHHNPHIEIAIEEHNVDDQIRLLMDDQLDIALVRLPVPQSEELDYLDVATRPLVAVVPSTHPALINRPLSLRSLEQETFMIQQDPPGVGLGWSALAACHRAGFTPQKIQHTRDVSVAVGLVAMGMGVTLVPQTQCSVMTPNVAYCPLEDTQATTTLTLCWQKRRCQNTLKHFVQSAREQVLKEKLAEKGCPSGQQGE